MHSKLWSSAVAAALALSACATSSVTRAGIQSYPELPASEDVAVFASDEDVRAPFEVVGMVEYVNPGKYRVLSLEAAMPALKAKARSVGANALIVDASQPIRSGFISTGIRVQGRAIRLADAAAQR